MGGAGGDLDRISALPDDLLHVILGCVESAPVVARTAVLSRRWRHVWPHAKNLTFRDDDEHLKNKGDFAGFVDWVLAQRGEADVESLYIILTDKGRASPDKTSEWLRYAVRRVVGSVDINLGPWIEEVPADEQVVELPSHGGRTSSISLYLSGRRIRLPAVTTARYEALTEFELWSVRFSDEVPAGAGSLGSSNQLGNFVMSCCPRLRRLHFSGAGGLTQLVLRTEVLEELSIFYARDLKMLDVVAPNLRVIELDQDLVSSANMVIRIVAPKLEEIHDSFPRQRDMSGLKSVRVLKNLWLDMHGKYYRDGDVPFWLLDNCPAVEHVDVCIHHGSLFHHGAAATDQLVDLASEGKAPFANVRTMVIWSGLSKHHLVASISSLLMRCPRLTSFTIQLDFLERNDLECLCEALTDSRCVVYGKLALESLQDVRIIGFSGTDEEMQLVSLLFLGARRIQSNACALN